MENKTFFDVAVIGGGPAGLMAAGRAGELGTKVILLEKNAALARKLLLTGKGRSNITRAEFNPRELVKKYDREGDFLLYPLSIFGVKETIDFFERRGLATKVERGKRIFPQSDSAQDVLRVLIGYLKKSGAGIMTNSEVKKIVKDKNRIAKIILSSGEEILAKNYIICTGGKSYPGTGSTGDGYQWAEELGHKINKLRPALVPLKIKENWPKMAQGLSLKNVELTVFQNNKKQDSRFGEMLFTHFGVSGPIVLDLSGKIGQLLERGEVKLVLDLKPALDFQTLDKRLRSDFSKYSRKLFKNSLSDLLPQKLIPVIIELSGINPEKKVNEITREERQKLVKLLKGLEMTVSSLLGFETAIVTSGGVSLKEIDSRTMKSKLVENLFLAGEIIDLHGPTGGYNLQLCWSTGYLAGQSAAKF
ncbi:MAG: NAD(P)/FAD-dependent oxidoreductase [bacterium]|nr:NAD(P)/FAD-dependent oxidoreductase [bacterium]